MTNNVYANQADALIASDSANQDRFDAWMHEVDVELRKRSGLTHVDLAGQSWWDWCICDDMSAADAAEMALEDEGFPV